MTPPRAHLTPTRITNKNGVNTTVYKNAPLPANNTAAPLPAPSLNPKAHSRSHSLTPEQRDEAIELFVVLSQKVNNPAALQSEDNKLRRGLKRYNNELIAKLLDRTKRTDSSKSAFLLAAEGKTQKYVNTYLALHGEDYDLIFRPMRPGSYSSRIHNAIDSLDAYPQLPYTHTDEYYRKATALTGIVAAIQDDIPNEQATSIDSTFTTNSLVNKKGDPKLISRLTNDDLVDLILERPEQWKEIAIIITSRKTQDPGTIREVLDHEVPTLKDGAL